MKTFLLDGLWGNSVRLGLMKQRLETSGVGDVEIVRYDSSGQSSLEREGSLLAERLARIGEAVNLVGYSMGGLVIRAARLADPMLRIHRAAFLNTPHQGSIIARLLPGAGFCQMRPGSAFLARLESLEWTVPTYVAWTPGDLVVVPATSARWLRASVVSRCGVPAHLWPIFCPKIHRELADFLRAS